MRQERARTGRDARPPTPADRDAAMVDLACRARGILDVRDLRSVGIGASAAHRRVMRGRLFRLHHGVYSIAPPHLLPAEARWLAAVRAVGAGAGLAWPHAGALWDLRGPPGGPVHVAAPGDGGRRGREGIVVHRCRSLHPSDIVVRRGIPVTSARRTLLDAKRAVPAGRYSTLLRQAERLQLDTGKLGDVEDVDANEIERTLLALCRRHGIPRPATQQIIGPYTVDFLWREAMLVAETDGWGVHGTRVGFEADRVRDAWLLTQGYRVVRFTWRRLRDDPQAVVATLRDLLGPRDSR